MRFEPASRSAYPWLWAGLVLVLLGVALGTRPLLPIDETRYVSVAWEMWLRGDFLVPHLNGATYSHKPPLLFWLIQAGWWAFGVSEWWPRAIPALFALGSVLVTSQLAQLLWPERRRVAWSAPTLLLGCIVWAVLSTIVIADLLLVFFTLLGILGVARAWRNRGFGAWLLLAAALGLGTLTKGPIVLLQTLPVALLAPWWAPGDRPRHWYAGIGLAVLLGLAFVLAWVIPAARSGGTDYANEILWSQTAGRTVRSFAHARPFWWYLPMVPVLLLPYSLWPRLWRSLYALGGQGSDAGLRFCIAWTVPVFAALSLISGKQIHYLLPMLPAAALIGGRALDEVDGAARTDLIVPAIVFVLAGAILAIGPFLIGSVQALVSRPLPQWLAAMSPLPGVILILATVLIMRRGAVEPGRAVAQLALLTAAFVVAVHVEAFPATRAYDLRAPSAQLAEWQRQGRPIAHLGKYHGQYQFLGRLTRPLDVIEEADIPAWLERHPEGKVVTYLPSAHEDGPAKPEYHYPFRGKTVALWGREGILAAMASGAPVS